MFKLGNGGEIVPRDQKWLLLTVYQLLLVQFQFHVNERKHYNEL